MIAAVITAALAISIPDLRVMAAQAITLEGGSPLTARELVAMALVESSGNPNAVGDGGRAVGLMQFWAGTWTDHANRGWRRTDPLASFRVAIRYAVRNACLCRKAGVAVTTDRLFSAHNQGNVRKYAAGYVKRCRAALARV